MNLLLKTHKGLATLDDQEGVLALNDPHIAYWFAFFVTGADVKRCQEVACRNPRYAYFFVHDVPGANIGKSLEACRGTPWENRLSQLLMNRALE